MKRVPENIVLPRAIHIALCMAPVAMGITPVAWASIDITDSGVVVSGGEESLSDGTFENTNVASRDVLQVKENAHLNVNNVTLNSINSGSGMSVNNSTVSGDGLDISVEGSSFSSAIYLVNAASVDLSNVTITTKDGALGLNLYGTAAPVTATISDSTLTTSGSGARVMYGELTLNNVNVTTSGASAYGVDVNNNGSVIINGGTYTTSGQYAHGAWTADANSRLAVDGATFSTTGNSAHAINAQNGSTTVKNSTLKTTGSNSYGLYTDSKAVADNLQIVTSGAAGVGVFAARGGIANVTNSNITTTGKKGAGLLVYPNAQITADNVNINTAGESAYGLWAYAGTLNVSNSDITTTGLGAHGLTAQYGSVNLSNSTITTTGDDASGIAVTGVSDTLTNAITLNNVTVKSDSGAAITVNPSSTTFAISDSTLTGGNGQVMNVVSQVDTSDPSVMQYSTVALEATNSVLNGAINIDSSLNTVDVSLLSNSTLNGAVTNAASLSLDATSTWNIDNSSTLGQLTNNGTIVFSDTSKFDTLTVNGNYRGDGGLLTMNSVLGDDGSAINKLIVTGDVEAGTTGITVNNLGGQGAQTVEGIQLVSVDGTSYGSFVKNGRIVAGAYDYDLIKKGESWYLTSYQTPNTVPDDASRVPNERPEGGSYIDNLAAANTMFATRLHDRLGDTQFVDLLSGEKRVTSLWLRQVGGHNRWRNDSGGLNTQSNRYVAQIGGDIAQWGTDELQHLHLGVMGGYANNQSNTDSSRYGSRGKVEGYSAGIYATWYANNTEKSGAYIDSWMLYNWFDNKVSGDSLAVESYKSKGFSASLETGYALKLAEFETNVPTQWFIQPQAQITWMGVKADGHTEQNGTRVSGEGDGNIQTRLGLRTWLRGHSSIDNGKERFFQPFVEANWLHNSRNFGVKMDDVTLSQSGAKDLAELKTGVEGQINPRLNLWGNVAVQVGNNGYSDTSAMLGVKYNF